MKTAKKIIVAPLNWGLGHATRCIPIILALQKEGFTPILASDGQALELLKKEFPSLQTFTLPAYNIKYAKKGVFLPITLLVQIPKLVRAVILEKKAITRYVFENQIAGIISDNRFGLFSKNIPTVYLTHQLHIMSGWFTFLNSKFHQMIIKKFDACWVPDFGGETNFSGTLGHLKHPSFPIDYIGVLSRFTKKKSPKKYDYLVLLSGPEPQRSQLEVILLQKFKNSDKQILFVLGQIEVEQKISQLGSITICNFMTTADLSEAIQSSEIVIARSGYTTIMDLAKLEKKAFFIPTPGQTEQLYLAKRLEKLKMAPYILQNEFDLKNLTVIANYSGLNSDATKDFSSLFSIFSKVKENSDPKAT